MLSTTQKPFSQACENNKAPILEVLKKVFSHSKCVLEIGSGTGQHAQFTVGRDPWPSDKHYDAAFTANTTHIMSPAEARQMMQMVGRHLPHNGIFCQYGPFCFSGNYTSPSNAAFDEHLRVSGFGGLRDVEDLKRWTDMTLAEVIAMPANNHVLVWKR
jgi:hypothetical protein